MDRPCAGDRIAGTDPTFGGGRERRQPGRIGGTVYGVGAGVRNLIHTPFPVLTDLVKASTGIGGGLIANGRLLRGASGCAGELGHAQIPSGRELAAGEALLAGVTEAVNRYARPIRNRDVT
jgi:hypothetical protein